MKLLITSVGSLVGQNILDVSDYPAYTRRPPVEVIGVNSVADAQLPAMHPSEASK